MSKQDKCNQVKDRIDDAEREIGKLRQELQTIMDEVTWVDVTEECHVKLNRRGNSSYISLIHNSHRIFLVGKSICTGEFAYSEDYSVEYVEASYGGDFRIWRKS